MYWNAIQQVSGSDASTTNATATDVTGLTFAALASSTYEIQAFLIASSSDANGCKYAVAFSAAGAVGSVALRCQTSSKTSGSANYMDLGTLSSTAFLTLGGSTKCGIFLFATVITGVNPGNITVQHAKVTAGTSSIYIGSVMKVRKLA